MYIYVLSKHVARDVTEISSWRILIQQVGNQTARNFFLVLFFFQFLSIFSSTFIIAKRTPWPLMLGFIHVFMGSYRSVSCDFKDNFMVLVLFPLPPWKGWGINFHEDESHGQLKFSLQVISTPFYDIVFIFCIIVLRELMPAKYRKCINFSFKSKCYIIHLVERK